METKFTKGQWHAVDYAGSFNIQNGPTYEDKDILSYDSIFPNDKYHISKEECEANCKLIAAAPELLNTIIAIQRRYSVKNGNMTGDLFDFCEQAIKKATE